MKLYFMILAFSMLFCACSNEEEMSPIEREMHEMLRGTWLHDWGPDAETDHTFYTFDNGTGTLCEGTKKPQSFRYTVTGAGDIKLFIGTNSVGDLYRIKNLNAQSMDFGGVKLFRVEESSVGSVNQHRIKGGWECIEENLDIPVRNYLRLYLFDSWMMYSRRVIVPDENNPQNYYENLIHSSVSYTITNSTLHLLFDSVSVTRPNSDGEDLPPVPDPTDRYGVLRDGATHVKKEYVISYLYGDTLILYDEDKKSWCFEKMELDGITE